MKHHLPTESPLAVARKRMTYALRLVAIFGGLFGLGLVPVLWIHSDAFRVVHIRGGFHGSGFSAPLVTVLGVAGIGTALAVHEVWSAWRAYQRAKNDESHRGSAP